MKNIVLSIFIFSVFPIVASAALTIEGEYHGKNLYVHNPYDFDTEKFCVTGVRVNGDELNSNYLSAAFEIKLNILDLELGDPVVIQIMHHDGCKPTVLNQYINHRTLRIEPASLKNGILRWKEDSDLRSYHIEQYRWNKWIKVDVTINDPDEDGYYSALLDGGLHSGTNTFRVAAENENGVKAYSNNLMTQNDLEPVIYEIRKNERLLVFSAKTKYELYDSIGEQVQMGESAQIDLSGFSSGDYYLNFDNYNSKIKVK